MSTIGKRIKQARSKVGITQAELSRRMNITRASVSIWESGGNVSQDNIIKVAKILKVTPEWLQYEVGANRDISVDILKDCLEAASSAVKKMNVSLTSKQQARLVAHLYTDALAEVPITQARTIDLIKIIL